MFSKMRIMKSARSFSEQIETLRKERNKADAVIIGAGISTLTNTWMHRSRFTENCMI